MKTTSYLCGILAAGSLILTTASPCAAAMLTVGDAAPSVAGVSDSGGAVNLADVNSKSTYTLVYFIGSGQRASTAAVPAAAARQLAASGVAVVGLSIDDAQVVRAFGLPTYRAHRIAAVRNQSFLIKGGKIIWEQREPWSPRDGEGVIPSNYLTQSLYQQSAASAMMMSVAGPGTGAGGGGR